MKAASRRQDVTGLATGLCFIVVLLMTMWIWGGLKGWDAQSGFTHDQTKTSKERLMPEPVGCNDTTIPGRSGAHCTTTWYYWKLPPMQATATTRAVVWICYALHQIFIWGLIYRAQLTVIRNKAERKIPKYSTNLRWFNWSMLIVNALFHVIHLVQTHITYDATAQDVSVSSSQSSVVMLLCFILLMEYNDRGVMLMWPNPKSEGRIANMFRLGDEPIKLIRKYHGFAFSWASIYTFWYHPMENTWGHTLGFFHTAIILLQGSLAFTEVHLNKYWRLLNECWVVLHATTVAIQTGDPTVKGLSEIWPIFAFGFGFVFAFTQIFSLSIWKKLPAWMRIIPPVLFLAIVSALCTAVVAPIKGSLSGFSRMHVMVFIPLEEYLQLYVTWLVLFLLLRLESKFFRGQEVKKSREKLARPSPTKQALCLCVITMIYGSFIACSYFYEQGHIPIPVTVSMIFLTFFFSVGACVSIMLYKSLMGSAEDLPIRKTQKIRNGKAE